MKPNFSFDPMAILARDPELFKNIEGEEIEAPRKFHWDALDNQFFIIHRIRGDLSGYILILSTDTDDIYTKTTSVIETSSTIVKKFLDNFSNELDLNFIIDDPQLCPATQNFSSEKEFGSKIMDFQSKRKLLKILHKYVNASGGFQFERMFKFKIKEFNFKFYFCLNANDIQKLSQ